MQTGLATVDISSLFARQAGAQARAASQDALHSALRETGFAVLRGTGVPPQT